MADLAEDRVDDDQRAHPAGRPGPLHLAAAVRAAGLEAVLVEGLGEEFSRNTEVLK